MTVEVDGADELVRELREAADKIDPAIREALVESSGRVKVAATAAATRHLGVRRVFDRWTKQGAGAIERAVETKGAGGAIFEFGTPSLPGGRPFMGPALEPERTALPEAVEKAVREVLP